MDTIKLTFAGFFYEIDSEPFPTSTCSTRLVDVLPPDSWWAFRVYIPLLNNLSKYSQAAHWTLGELSREPLLCVTMANLLHICWRSPRIHCTRRIKFLQLHIYSPENACPRPRWCLNHAIPRLYYFPKAFWRGWVARLRSQLVIVLMNSAGPDWMTSASSWLWRLATVAVILGVRLRMRTKILLHRTVFQFFGHPS